MKVLLCAASALTLTGCGSLAEYTGPALRFSIGWHGIDAGVTLYGKKPPSESLREAGKSFDALLPGAGSSGKTPVPDGPFP